MANLTPGLTPREREHRQRKARVLPIDLCIGKNAKCDLTQSRFWLERPGARRRRAGGGSCRTPGRASHRLARLLELAELAVDQRELPIGNGGERGAVGDEYDGDLALE